MCSIEGIGGVRIDVERDTASAYKGATYDPGSRSSQNERLTDKVGGRMRRTHSAITTGYQDNNNFIEAIHELFMSQAYLQFDSIDKLRFSKNRKNQTESKAITSEV